MTVRPTPSGQHPSIGITRAQRSNVGSTPPRSGDAQPQPAPDSRTDGVHISAEARELQRTGFAAPSEPDLPAARMREVLDRMSTGHYDRPEVQRVVVERLVRDL